MTAILIYRSGSQQGQKATLSQDITRLGRKTNNHIILDDELVSSHHAEIHRKGDAYYLVDLESTNGTFVNGKAIQKMLLNSRDKIEFGEGGPVLEFRYEKKEEDRSPKICPLSGPWEKGLQAIPLERSRITIGRSLENNVVAGRVPESLVSAQHAVISGRDDLWEIEDLNSSNGTLINGKPIKKAKLHDGDRVELGRGGPVFEFRCASSRGKQRVENAGDSERLLQKLERASKGGRAGEQTMALLQVAQKYHKRRRWPLLVASGFVLVAALVTSCLYYLKVKENRQFRASAEDIFYRMRSIEAQLVLHRSEMSSEELARKNRDRDEMEREYDRFLEKLGAYKGKTAVDKAIMRLARRLGETDLAMPADFNQTVLAYVAKWRSTPRLRIAFDRARQRHLPQIIRTALDLHGLPRELIFIPLQESGYDHTAVGPTTHFGIAKGMWQMIPPTAKQYNLNMGPLKDVREFDPSDDRHNELLSTNAATSYLAYLYSTKAAASGLLVIASYNYGQSRIIKKLDTLPNDPRQRSFWNFYNNGWLPEETRDYVMQIFSAALICKNPELFQMNIEPLMRDW
jgi:membrane-bound lytic murein transglycosylase D